MSLLTVNYVEVRSKTVVYTVVLARIRPYYDTDFSVNNVRFRPYTTRRVTTVYVVVNGSARLVYGGRNDGPGM